MKYEVNYKNSNSRYYVWFLIPNSTFNICKALIDLEEEP